MGIHAVPGSVHGQMLLKTLPLIVVALYSTYRWNAGDLDRILPAAARSSSLTW